MKEVFLHVFSEVVELLLMSGYIKQENFFVDGTKIEANANKYSAVWSKNVKRYKELVRKKCEVVGYSEKQAPNQPCRRRGLRGRRELRVP